MCSCVCVCACIKLWKPGGQVLRTSTLSVFCALDIHSELFCIRRKCFDYKKQPVKNNSRLNKAVVKDATGKYFPADDTRRTFTAVSLSQQLQERGWSALCSSESNCSPMMIQFNIHTLGLVFSSSSKTKNKRSPSITPQWRYLQCECL